MLCQSFHVCKRIFVEADVQCEVVLELLGRRTLLAIQLIGEEVAST